MTNNMTNIKRIKLNVYSHEGVWCYSLWIDGEFDHSDTVDVEDDAAYPEAREAAIEALPEEIKRGAVIARYIEEMATNGAQLFVATWES